MKTLITGGAGFIGSNAAARCLARGDRVAIVDDLSRQGAASNLEWLRGLGHFDFHRVDLRDAGALADVVSRHRDAERILHLAGQVAVTTSVQDPRSDFEVNAAGTFNLLEAVRRWTPGAALLYASTNKVYGGLAHLEVVDQDGRYGYRAAPFGVDEREPLDFHSPYGCSKGSADQYVRDYHRIYGLKSVVFRQSCIYGYRQFGMEDQGWVAWFVIAAARHLPMRVYGDGKQARDVLFVDDLLDAFDCAFTRIDRAAGRVYNIGGGPANTISLHQLLGYLEERNGARLAPTYHDWRPGDQRVFVSDIRRSRAELGWAPKTPWRSGVELLCEWVKENEGLFASA
jgi:CDP-paratose 2-epimerase